MLYLDHTPMLWQWRTAARPAAALRQLAPCAYPLADCPTTPEKLERDLAFLPPSALPWHFMVSSKNYRLRRSEFGYSECSKPLPREAFLQLNGHVCLATPALVYLQHARHLPLPLLIKLGCELCGTYTMTTDADALELGRDGPLATVGKLRSLATDASWLAGSRAALRSLQYVVEGSASVKETELEMLMCLPPNLGGYGLPCPKMNWRVEFDDKARIIASRAYAVCDLCWPGARLDVEYDGRMWHEGQAATSDKARANALKHMGWDVIFVSRDELRHPDKLDAIVRCVARRIGHRIRDRHPEARLKRMQLHTQLMRSSELSLFTSLSVAPEQRVWLESGADAQPRR